MGTTAENFVLMKCSIPSVSGGEDAWERLWQGWRTSYSSPTFLSPSSFPSLRPLPAHPRWSQMWVLQTGPSLSKKGSVRYCWEANIYVKHIYHLPLLLFNHLLLLK